MAGTTDVAPQLRRALEGSLAALRRSAEAELPAVVVLRLTMAHSFNRVGIAPRSGIYAPRGADRNVWLQPDSSEFGYE